MENEVAIHPPRDPTQAARVLKHWQFGPRAIAVAHFLRGVGATPTDDTIALLAEIERRWPQLSFRDLHGAAGLAAALALKPEVRA
jgi:hypothetical protein